MSLAFADSNDKFCQSCIERGFNPPQLATREYQTGLFYCDECFNAILDNLTNIAPAELIKTIIPENNIQSGPILDFIYSAFSIPPELQFQKVDTVCRNSDKLYTFHAPAVINKTKEEIRDEVEQLAMTLFHVKYRHDFLTDYLKKLKSEEREAKNLKGIEDSREVYAKTPRKEAVKKIKVSQEEKMAKTLGMNLSEYRQFMAQAADRSKKEKEKKFNRIVGNCGECGGSIPCKAHPNERGLPV